MGPKLSSPLLLASSLLLAMLAPGAQSSKVIEFGAKLPDFIHDHPTRQWLILFYAPWCGQCQSFEPEYLKAAEEIYHRHDNLVVGRVDCAQNHDVCEMYGVKYYPTVYFMYKDQKLQFTGPRSTARLLHFVDRVLGPDVTRISECNELKKLISKTSIGIVSTESNQTGELHEAFLIAASNLKTRYDFYHLTVPCNFYKREGIYIIRQDFYNDHIEFDQSEPRSRGSKDELADDITNWLTREAWHLIVPLDTNNFDEIVTLGKTLIVAVLDEYKPSRKYTKISQQMLNMFRGIVRKIAPQFHKSVMYASTSDIELIETIALAEIHVPNVMVLRPDLSSFLLVEDPPNPNLTQANPSVDYPEQLTYENIHKLIEAVKEDLIEFSNGPSCRTSVARFVFRHYHKARRMYRNQPILAFLVIGFPLTLVALVMYTTCCSDYDNNEDPSVANGYGPVHGEPHRRRRDRHQHED